MPLFWKAPNNTLGHYTLLAFDHFSRKQLFFDPAQDSTSFQPGWMEKEPLISLSSEHFRKPYRNCLEWGGVSDPSFRTDGSLPLIKGYEARVLVVDVAGIGVCSQTIQGGVEPPEGCGIQEGCCSIGQVKPPDLSPFAP
jgi:hypothetical protein